MTTARSKPIRDPWLAGMAGVLSVLLDLSVVLANLPATALFLKSRLIHTGL
jgi:hypothetical protein